MKVQLWGVVTEERKQLGSELLIINFDKRSFGIAGGVFLVALAQQLICR